MGADGHSLAIRCVEMIHSCRPVCRLTWVFERRRMRRNQLEHQQPPPRLLRSSKQLVVEAPSGSSTDPHPVPHRCRRGGIRERTTAAAGTPTVPTREEIAPMSMTSNDAATGRRDIKSHETTSFADLGKEMWAYLTGKGAAINYEFVDMVVEVPRETGREAPRAVWRLNGTLRITTAENASRG
jgi:hypothetical protein